MGERFGVSRLFTGYRAMLDDPELDAVSIVTMWDRHAAPALAALQAGKHVFLEKPLASTAEDCQAIVSAAAASPRVCLVGHICRFNPRYAAAKREIESGALGKIVSIYARRNIPAAVSQTVLAKIGPILGDGIHDTGLMLWFTGAVGVCENVWYLPEKTPYRIDERMEIIGAEGAPLGWRGTRDAVGPEASPFCA